MRSDIVANIGIVTHGLDVTMHRHAAVQLVFSLDRPFQSRINGQEYAAIDGFMVDSGIPHECKAHGAQLVIINVAPFDATAQAWRVTQLGDQRVRVFPQLRGDAGLDAASDDVITPTEATYWTRRANRAFERVRAQLALPTPKDPQVLDTRIIALLDAIEHNTDTKQLMRDFASTVFLSTSRLAALFREQTGVSLMRYAQWQRLARAVRRILASTPSGLTELAHDAGYHDLPHLHRSLRVMLGVSPRMLAENSHLIQAIDAAGA
jgi:AraC-like DNA-binding protein